MSDQDDADLAALRAVAEANPGDVGARACHAIASARAGLGLAACPFGNDRLDARAAWLGVYRRVRAEIEEAAAERAEQAGGEWWKGI